MRLLPRSRLGRVVLVVLALPVVYLAYTFISVWRLGHGNDARRSDAIVVLGAAQYDGRPSPALQRRLDRVIELYRDEVAATVVVTGGKQPGDRFTEASASAIYLTAHGVPDKAILREVNGRSSWQSLVDAAAILRARGLRRVVLVSDGYHAARIEGIAEEVGLDAVVSPVDASDGAPEVARYASETVIVAAARITSFQRVVRLSNRVREEQGLPPG